MTRIIWAIMLTRTRSLPPGGHTVNLLVDTAPGTAGSGLKPECAAVFVADGVRYTLSGHVTQQTMRAIVDSMSYA